MEVVLSDLSVSAWSQPSLKVEKREESNWSEEYIGQY